MNSHTLSNVNDDYILINNASKVLSNVTIVNFEPKNKALRYTVLENSTFKLKIFLKAVICMFFIEKSRQ